MNNFTLKFTDETMQNAFQNESKLSSNYYVIQQWICFILICSQLIFHALHANYFMLALNVLLLILLLTSMIFIKIPQQLFQITYILGYNLHLPICLILNFPIHQSNYFDGYFTAFITLMFLNLNGYSKSLLILILAIILNLVLQRNLIMYQWIEILSFVLITILFVFYQHQFTYRDKLKFIETNKKQKIEENLHKLIEVDTYCIQFDSVNNQFKLQSNSDQRNFRILFRKININLKMLDRRQLKQYKKSINLEQFLFYYFTNISKLSAFPQSNENEYQLTGNIGKSYYNISIFEYYNIQRSVIIQLTQSKKDLIIEVLKLKNEILTQSLMEVSHIQKTGLRDALIYVSWINANKAKATKHLDSFILMINSKLTHCYNSLKNLLLFFNIPQESERMHIVPLPLFELMQNVANLTMYRNPKRFLNFQIINNLQLKEIHQDYGLLKQLLLNLLKYTTKFNNSVNILLNEELLNDQQLIRITFLYHTDKFSEDFNQLPIINPQSIDELKHNSKMVFLNLLLPIAIKILRKLSPDGKIKITQHQNLQKLEFLIFAQMNADFTSMKFELLKPSTRIDVLNQKIQLNNSEK